MTLQDPKKSAVSSTNTTKKRVEKRNKQFASLSMMLKQPEPFSKFMSEKPSQVSSPYRPKAFLELNLKSVNATKLVKQIFFNFKRLAA